MLRQLIQHRIAEAIASLQARQELPTGLDSGPIEIADPREASHGDFACNFALVAAKQAGMNPRELAEKLRRQMLVDDAELGEVSGAGRQATGPDAWGLVPGALFTSIDVAGPGFLNFRFTDAAWLHGLEWANVAAENLAKPASLDPRPSTLDPSLRLNVEFVSVNPNGPITVGSGRGAAFGSTLCNVLEAAGHEVHREYYINDGVNSEQMRQFAMSVRALSLGAELPEKAYRGDYVQSVADDLITKFGMVEVSSRSATSESLLWFQKQSEASMIAAQNADLKGFAVCYDTWFSEQSLHDSGAVDAAVQDLVAKGAADDRPIRRVLKLAKGGVIEDVEIVDQPNEEVDEDLHSEGAPGIGHRAPDAEPDAQSPAPDAEEDRNIAIPQYLNTLWLRSTKFADDMDRVLRRKDGRLTYIASDVAYHKDKFNRPANADKLITILGPDHHGYIGRLHAVVAALLEKSGLPSSFGRSANEEGPGEENSGTSGSLQPLTDIERKLYSSEAERDACLDALEESKKRLEVIIFQIVRFVKDGKPAPMRKRDGNIYSLRDLMAEIGKDAAPNATPEEQMVVGKDVARFFYLMRSHDTHMDFDIDLATKGTEENPVFYVQYAHARICSILKKAEEALGAGLQATGNPPGARSPAPGALHSKESALIKKILDLPDEVLRCAADYGVHRLTTYAIELARTFHHFYDACRVIQPEDMQTTRRRLEICRATQHALKGALDLLGVSAPERMERESAG